MLKMVWATVLLLLTFFHFPAYADEPFELTIQILSDSNYWNSTYYTPQKNIIRIRADGPTKTFRVVLKNISSSNQRLNYDTATLGLGMLSFEMSDESGNENIVTKKVDPIQSKSQTYSYIAPGATKEWQISLTAREWDNAYKLIQRGATKVRARASYKNGSSIIHSDYYTLLLVD